MKSVFIARQQSRADANNALGADRLLKKIDYSPQISCFLNFVLAFTTHEKAGT